MFVGFLKDYILNTTEDNISLSEKKKTFVNKWLFFDKSAKKGDWYILKNTNLLFHSSWVNIIKKIDDNYVIFRDEYRNYIIGSHDIDNDTYVDLYGNSINRDLTIGGDMLRNTEYSPKTYAQPRKIKCSHCNHIVPYYSTSSIDHMICLSCEKEIITKCRECGSRILKTDGKMYNGEYYCEECYSMFRVCYICENVFPSNESVKVGGNYICKKCASKEEIERCNVCGNIFYKKDNLISNYRGNQVCTICRFKNNLSARHNPMMDYNYKQPLKFYGKSPNKLFYGIELEVVHGIQRKTRLEDPIALYLLNNIFEYDDNFIITKFDSSIGRYNGHDGFEIVSQPFSYDWIKSDVGFKTFEKIFGISKFNVSADNEMTCGMHVHMSKNAFRPKQIYNFLNFIYTNKDFILKISERIVNATTLYHMDFDKSVDKIEYMAKNFDNGDEDHHKAVNMNSPDTVEVRFFKSTIKWERFIKNIECCQAIYDFALTNKTTTVNNFVKFVEDNKEMYPQLFIFLGEIK